MKLKKPERRLPIDLRRQAQQRTIATLLLLGYSIERIARKLHCTGRAIRYAVERPDFVVLFDTIQREHFQRIDRHLGALLGAACDALEKMLRNSDWRARDAALGHIFAIHGKYEDRCEGGPIHRLFPGRVVQGELMSENVVMDEAMREKARELLSLQRAALQKSLPARIVSHDPLERDRDPMSGRFSPNPDNGDRKP